MDFKHISNCWANSKRAPDQVKRQSKVPYQNCNSIRFYCLCALAVTYAVNIYLLDRIRMRFWCIYYRLRLSFASGTATAYRSKNAISNHFFSLAAELLLPRK